MSRLMIYLIAAITAVINWLFYYLAAKVLHSSDPIFIANALILAVVAHEVAHVIALESNRIKTWIAFYVLFGGARPTSGQKKKLKDLSWSVLAWIFLAGTTANLLLIVFSLLMGWSHQVAHEKALLLVNLNGAFIICNLVPVWKFDGGQFAKVLFDSVPEHLDGKYVDLMFLALGAAAFVLILMTKAFAIIIPLIFWGIQFQSTHDDPNGSSNKLAMTTTQRRLWAGYYVFLLVVGLAAAMLTPSWII